MSKDEIIAKKDTVIAKKDAAIAQRESENAILKAENAYLKKMIYGSKTERFVAPQDSNQLNLFTKDAEELIEEQDEVKQTISYDRKKKKHPGRNKLPEHLPVEEIIIEPEGNTEGLKKIGEEVTETLKYTPASLVRLRIIRPKYEKLNQEGILMAPMPNRPIHKCIAQGSLLAHIMVCKFVDHLPFYRQIKRFKRDFDWRISSSTINDWFIACCTLLEPVYQEMVKQIQLSNYLQVDESPLKVLESEKGKQIHQGYMWVYHCLLHKTIVFNYRKGRGMQGPKEMLKDFQGYLQCDGYTVYDKIGYREGIELVGCMTHARRYFHEALDNDRKRAEYALETFKQIYDLEREWKELSVEQIYENRQQHTKQKLIALKAWCSEQGILVLPKSTIGKAVRYYMNQYHKLIRVVDDGRLKIDNNLIENKIRPLALGRKNYLFAGSHAAGQRIAMMYSFFASAKAKDVNPRIWLENTLEQLADPHFVDYKSLIP